MLKFEINTRSVDESNLFLRKLWCELNEIRKIGWEYCPWREGNVINIGISTFGMIHFDYNVKGCIKNLYIDNESETQEIKKAVKNALENDMRKFSIEIIVENRFKHKIAKGSIINTAFDNDQSSSRILANIQAYSSWDLKKIVTNKIMTIQALLYEYTHSLFTVKSINYANDPVSFESTEDEDYDYQWIDSSDRPTTSNGDILISQDCLKLIFIVLCNDYSDDNIGLLLNSSRVLFSAQELLGQITNCTATGISDIMNSIMVSSFEPLALILDKRVERCNECGNLQYSIVFKIRNLIMKYFNENLAKHICNEIYSSRSAYLHEGHMETTDYLSDVCYPQINPINKNSMMLPTGMVNYTLQDYSSYIFRNLAHEYLQSI